MGQRGGRKEETTDLRWLFAAFRAGLILMEPEGEMRLDKWLWCARIYKTRREATEACRSGRVSLNGKTARPARCVRCGDLIEARTTSFDRKMRVSGLVGGRVGAKRVPELLEDLTPKEEYERGRKTAIERVLGRAPGSGRPTKRERRDIDRLIGGSDDAPTLADLI